MKGVENRTALVSEHSPSYNKEPCKVKLNPLNFNLLQNIDGLSVFPPVFLQLSGLFYGLSP